MVSYSFPYYVSFGCGDSSDGTVDVELSEEESERLRISAEKSDDFAIFEADEISDICDKVFECAVSQEINCLRENDSHMREQVGEALNIENYDEHDFTDEELREYLTNYLSIVVNYPLCLI